MATSAPISIGIDGSDTAVTAARWAAAFGRMTHTPLRVVHSMNVPGWYLGSAAYVSEIPLSDEMHALGRRHLDAATDAIVAVDPAAAVERVGTELSITDYLARVDSSLVVLGSGRTGPVRDIVLGGNTIRIIDRVQCPVMIRRQDDIDTTAHHPVVVGVDGSPESDRAMLAAFEYADLLNAPVTAAHFWGVSMKLGLALGAGYIDWERVGREERKWLWDRVEPLRQKFPDVSVGISTSSASPSTALRALSTSARLVVVGSRGRGRVAGAALGSVSQNMVHHARCSVLVVR